MKNGLHLIVIVLKAAVAAYLFGCVGLSWLKQIRRELERFSGMQSKEHKNGGTESETRQFSSIEDTAAQSPGPSVAETRTKSHGSRTGPIGNQTEKVHRHGVRRLCL